MKNQVAYYVDYLVLNFVEDVRLVTLLFVYDNLHFLQYLILLQKVFLHQVYLSLVLMKPGKIEK